MTDMPEQAATAGSPPRCRRCGLCCLKGGATLMAEDADLLRPDADVAPLPLTALVCLRAGEWARDEVYGGVRRPLSRELLKLAPAGQSTEGTLSGAEQATARSRAVAAALAPAHPWACAFYVPERGCSIYARRPVQCSVLFCADTAPLECLLARADFLSRTQALDVVLHAEGSALPPSARQWAELIAAHEESCPAGRALALAARLGFAPQGLRRAARDQNSCRDGRAEGEAAAGDGSVPPPSVPSPCLPPRCAPEERAAVWAELGESLRFDAAFRQLCVQRAAVPARLLPFLLGRPLAQLLADVGLTLRTAA